MCASSTASRSRSAARCRNTCCASNCAPNSTLLKTSTRNVEQNRDQDGIGELPELCVSAGGEGPWPGVLVFMDGIGIRPAMLELGEKLAMHGYFVLLPDLFYRSGPYEPMDPKTVFTDPEKRKVLMEKS